MSKALKVICIILVIVIILGLIFFVVDYNRAKNNDFNSEMGNNENDSNKQDENTGDKFNATIEKINEYNGIITISVTGLEENDINHRGEFELSIDDDTEILWKDTKVEIADLKVSQTILIESTGEILETYPAQIKKVIKIVILNDEI